MAVSGEQILQALGKVTSIMSNSQQQQQPQQQARQQQQMMAEQQQQQALVSQHLQTMGARRANEGRESNLAKSR